MPKRRFSYLLSRLVVALASPLVPRWRRSEWRETWQSELWHGSSEPRTNVVRRSTGAVSHAAWLRFNDGGADGLLQDIRYGFRSLRKEPGFSVVAVLVLTLGIGANTTIFSLVNGLLVRPFGGVTAAEELVGVWRAREGQPSDNWSYPNYLDIRNETAAFAGAVVFAGRNLTLHDGDTLERMPTQLVSRDYFEVLGVRMVRGAPLDAEDGTRDIVLSHGAWQRRFGGRDVVGEIVRLNNTPLRVAGIAEPGFLGLSRTDLPDAWIAVDMEVPLGLRDEPSLQARGNSWLTMVARLAPGITMPQANAAAALTTEALRESRVNSSMSILLAPANGFAPEDAGEAGLVLGVLMFLVGLLLLIACANVANLLLARGRTRTHEYGIRLAVGASRGRLVRQLLVESLLLSLAAAAAGVLLAQWSAALLVTLFESLYQASFAIVISPDLRIMAFSFAVAFASVLLFGVAPAIQAARKDAALLMASGASTSGPRRAWAASGMVVGQVALSLVVLSTALLFVRSLQAVRSIDPGMNVAELVVVTPMAMDENGSDDSPLSSGWRASLADRVRGLPDVTGAVWIDAVPLSGPSGRQSVSAQPAAVDTALQVAYNAVESGYFRATSIALLAGRDFSPADTAATARVVIVNELLAEQMWPGVDPIGRSLFVRDQEATVVGVAATTKYSTLTERPRPYMYTSIAQSPTRRPSLLVRTSGNQAAMMTAVRGVMAALPETVVSHAMAPMTEILATSFGQQIVFARVIGLFSFIALALAVAGAYGVTSYVVSQRTAEIGIRMALGAGGGQVMRSVTRRGVILAGGGIVVGMVLTSFATPAVASLTPGVSPRDPVTLAISSLALFLAVVLAGLIPARRAARVDPVIALRQK